MSYGNGVLGPPAQIVTTGGQQSAQAVYQHILDTATKRISTLDYLRKSHEGRVYWFNTLLYTKPELLKLPYFSPPRLARRAQNYLLLGFSLPMILDLNSQTPTEYLRALNALLGEFEQYQAMHPPDGSSSSLSRARIPSMFKRGTSAAKTRRLTESAPPGQEDVNGMPNGGGGAVAAQAELLLPQDTSYTHLLTPPLPFDPDFFETFATLCDVLIDCYSRVTALVNSPEVCGTGTGVGELFTKVDSRVRKIIVSGVVKEFEERCREGVKGEISGVGKVVLGGLI
ncbi:hypothetical protein BT63DRAFT_409739 [Microthyrium microscopicum]|uniref:Uncharacterized protein n=1 Tax=Microthyrium microscopicum TaxID=703497 RepID=A0A6A6UMA9_9PEZI|nr:hypothetical protein BT63DRAFT_409739 [Microthyrium microscopicum]